MTSRAKILSGVFHPSVIVVCLGYFADAFDLFLYNAVRVPSLTELGFSGDGLTSAGLWILNLQVAGMFLGGFLWGVLGDRIGRKKALVGSVLLYSLGSLGCAVIHSVFAYAAMRFLTGIGLAGEIGLGATLIIETLRDRRRDWGIVAFTWFCNFGILAANLLANMFDWRSCYAIGGAIGLAILLGRMALMESGLFEDVARTKIARGSFRMFFTNRDFLKRWLACVFFTMPYFYTVNLLVSLAPEFGKAVGVAEPVKAPVALAVFAVCVLAASVFCVLACRLFQSRLRAIALFMGLNVFVSAFYLMQSRPGLFEFYGVCALFGLCNFYTLLLFAAPEQFGTNMRATGATSALSTGRATLVLTNSLFLGLRASGFDMIPAAGWTGAAVFLVGFTCLFGLKETYHRGMDFIEEGR